jgi:hypothetical protein
MARGALPLKNAQKMVDCSSKKCVFGLEIMGFFLQYDLGIMEKKIDGFKVLKHI